MYDVILIRFGEIGLKGKNRSQFYDQLVDNIKDAVTGLGEYQLKKTHGRIYVFPRDNFDRFLEQIVKVPGVVSASPALISRLDFEDLKQKSLKAFRKGVSAYPTTFKVETRRANKDFPRTSIQISSDIGAIILKNIDQGQGEKLSVDVHNPEHRLYIEIRQEHIYVYTDILEGPGGLPVGSGGRGLLLLSGGIDSPVAGWLGLKRGLELEAIYFHSFPYTSDRVREKVVDLARVLSQYGKRIKLYTTPFTEIQQAIQENCEDKNRITLMRRMMMRIATIIARNNNDQVLLTGESLGQVASQTVESMSVISQAIDMPILRPLVTRDKDEIMDLARDIGTYEIS
ncbi:MAG: tRNA uracil 4-sulfurtransferase ThiI, partial [Bacillota bacterium]